MRWKQGYGGMITGHHRLPTSTRVASESGGIFSKIPDGERPSVPPSPCWKAGDKGSIWPLPPLPTLISNHVQVEAFWLSPHTPGMGLPVHKRALSPVRGVGGAKALRVPQNVSQPWASHPLGPLGLRHGCRTHREHGLSFPGWALSRVETGCGRDQVGIPSDPTRERPWGGRRISLF